MSDYFTAFERRASTVLYRYLRGVERPGIWLLPANVCPIVPAVFYKAAKTFEFVDISPDTLCLDTNEVFARVQRAPSEFAGVLFVHTYGHPGQFEKLFMQLKSLDRELQVIDDRCLCRPRFGRAGTVADLELYSSGYSKFVDVGWGGWGHIRKEVAYRTEPLPFDPAAHERLVQRFRTTMKEGTSFTCPDDEWLDAQPAGVTLEHFQEDIASRLPSVTQHRGHLNSIYLRQLEPWALPQEFRNWRFTIRCTQKEELLEAIFAAGHFASGHYIALAPMFGSGNTLFAERLGRQVVNLFNDFRYTADRAIELANLIVSHLQRRAA